MKVVQVDKTIDNILNSLSKSSILERKKMSQKAIIISNLTKEKVEAAKIYIEQRYSKLIQQEKGKRQYWEKLNEKMKIMNISTFQKQQIKNNILHKEALKLREQRKKITIMDFQSIRIIGKGAFGEVRLCKWVKNNEPVAVKKLKKSQMIFKNKVIQVRQQRNVLANCENNPWIVGLKCSFQDNDHLYLVMDYVPGGDLMNLLIKKDIFSHDEAKFYIAQMILAIQSVHKLNYIHRDIKPDNILIDQRGHIKLSDFGLCKHTETRPKKLIDNIRNKQYNLGLKNQKNGQKDSKHRRKLAFSAVGTPDYVAPEVQGKNGYNQTVDWWSLGVIFYEMLVGYAPFASQNSSITWQKIQNWRKYLVIPKQVYVSPQANDLIRKLINDPQVRLGCNGVEEIKAHPFFYGIDWNRIRQKKAPNIPMLKNLYDTSNFDPFQQQQPWINIKTIRGKNCGKKGTQFIGYTYKQQQDSNSQLIKALIDLDNYKKPQQIHRNNVDSMGLDIGFERYQKNIFKKEKGDQKKQVFTLATTNSISPKYSTTQKGWEGSSNKITSPTNRQKPQKKPYTPVLMKDDKKPTKTGFGFKTINELRK